MNKLYLEVEKNVEVTHIYLSNEDLHSLLLLKEGSALAIFGNGNKKIVFHKRSETHKRR